MKKNQQYVSPDGHLRLTVEYQEDGDSCVGFQGYPWHTHGDLLTAFTDLSQQEAIRSFVDGVVNDEELIVVSRKDGQILDIWVTEDQAAEMKYKPDDESLEFRFWSGKIFK